MPPAAPSTETLACFGADTLNPLEPALSALLAARLINPAIAKKHVDCYVSACCARRQNQKL